ncbi:MAG: DUF5131 family protein [Hyphomicrobiales bacterium]|nr:DUF5131 family protein [Hyphomicrobiales bacterium]
MGYPTEIQWTDATWNPIAGCSIVSPGCSPCYAQKLAGTRLSKHPLYAGTTTTVKGKPVFNGKLTAAGPNDAVWSWPLRWKGAEHPKLGRGMPSLIFVGDMSDLLHENRSLGYFMRVLDVGFRSKHIIQVLTKRADVLAKAVKMWMDTDGEDYTDFKNALGPAAVRAAHKSGRAKLFADMLETMGKPPPGCAFPLFDWMQGPLYWPQVMPRIWLGFSAERQREFDERWAAMRDIAAAGWTIFVSYEPAIGPLVLPADFLALGRRAQVISGGMSGSEATPANPSWFRDVRDQCLGADVAYFHKQNGEWAPEPDWYANYHQSLPCIIWNGNAWSDDGGVDGEWLVRVGKARAGRLLDGREWNEFPIPRRNEKIAPAA